MSGLLRRIRRPGAAEETRTMSATPRTSRAGPRIRPATALPRRRGRAAALPAGARARGRSSAARRPGAAARLRRRRATCGARASCAARPRRPRLRGAAGGEQDPESSCEAKVQRLAALDAELHALEGRARPPHRETVLREPGVGGTCPSCGELHASDARSARPAADLPLTGRAARGGGGGRSRGAARRGAGDRERGADRGAAARRARNRRTRRGRRTSPTPATVAHHQRPRWRQGRRPRPGHPRSRAPS